MAKVRLLFSADAVRLGERVALALEAAGHAMAIGLHDTGDLDPRPVVATIVVWSRDVASNAEVLTACAEAASGSRLVPLTLGAGAPLGSDGPFAAVTAINLAGWAGATSDPRWKFVLEEIELAAARPIAAEAGVMEPTANAGVTLRTVAAGLGAPKAMGALGVFVAAAGLLTAGAVGLGGGSKKAVDAAKEPSVAVAAARAEVMPAKGAFAGRAASPKPERLESVQAVAAPDVKASVAPSVATRLDETIAALASEDAASSSAFGAAGAETSEALALARAAGDPFISPDGSEESLQDGVIAEGDADYGSEEEFDVGSDIASGDDVDRAAAALADASMEDDPIAVLAMAASLDASADAARRPAPAGDLFRDCDDCPLMARAPAGSYAIGSPLGEASRTDAEGPMKAVQFESGFAIGAYEVTFAEWDACVADGGCRAYRPSDLGWGRGSRPVLNVSYYDALDYAAWLSGKTGARYRLPSEAEWEYAARAGGEGPFSFDGEVLSDARANYHGAHAYNGPAGRFRQKTTPVGQFPKNAFGLYDVHGNVWEWTADCWAADHDAQRQDGAPLSAADDADCTRRVTKGGAWNSGGWRLRAAYREGQTIDKRSYAIGFRVVREIGG
ncbi:MAG: formylglycine-generating enzyme family protein [Pseudomonadota bacterium]